MIEVYEAEGVLSEMLSESGFDINNPNPKLAWETFKKFSKVKIDCADDSLLFQCGVYEFTGKELFHFEFVRQFSIEEGGEYDHIEQLMLTIYFKPNAELKELETNLWTYDFNSIDQFFNEVEKMDYFKIPIEKHVPFQAEVEQEEV
ncbi:hypothetical protein [Clostridium sp. HMP27]|uniref:hypothetical protein n=1 Tax=Clostridium sp. HMP27 TaxID=1487921 RepID=UPI00052E1B82|nr:hypothetical protein [Clostridium sp. HMP27]KGK81027.1 hypothetical protein DP68_18725 [Clostridium sp. HMP27]